MVYDVLIIGAGVVGTLIARKLSLYDLNVCILESRADVALGNSKANSGIVHAGYDAMPGTMKAFLNIKGNWLYDELYRELDIPFKRIGSFVIAFSKADMEKLRMLYQRGLDNGVSGLRLLNSYNEISLLEPGISPEAIGALYAPSAGITCPFELAVGAAENAVENGTELKLETKVDGIEHKNGMFHIETNKETVLSKYVVNAAGLYSDDVAQMTGDYAFSIKPRKGEYMLLDKSQGQIVNKVIFQAPTESGKGILVTPTVDGNLLLGPTASDIDDKDDFSTTLAGMNEVIRGALKSVPGINVRQVITSFAGLRAVPSTGDFIIQYSNSNKRLLHVAGIESPGLTAAPAIAEYAAELLEKAGLELVAKKNRKVGRKSIVRFIEASEEEKIKLIKSNKLYGNVICRCETVTEAEIIESIRRPAGAVNLDAVKRRTRAGMGRCQGGFCTPKIIEILSRELRTPMESIVKSERNSLLLNHRTKEVE